MSLRRIKHTEVEITGYCSVERRPGGWSLVAVKLDAAERRHPEAEHERFMQALAASPLADAGSGGTK